MYSSYFGFAESPFENNLDQRFLYLSNDHREVLESLLYFIKARKAIAIVCGDAGTGKTLLINSLFDHLPKSVKLITINNPHVSFMDILLCLANTLDLKFTDNGNVLQIINTIINALINEYRDNKYYILIIDEAHLFSIQSLQDIRLLSNIEIREGKLLQIIFFGQYELSSNLNQPEMQALRQRINVNRTISPLNQRETIEYINHRLTKVGSSFDGCFESNCGKFIYHQTAGVPRRINQLCDTALVIGMAENLKKINVNILKDATKAVKTDTSFTAKAVDQKKAFLRPAIALMLVMGLLLLGGLLGRTFSLDMKALRSLYEFLPLASTFLAPAQDMRSDSTLPTKIVVGKGDNLSKIATQYYSKNPKFGLIAISLANPKIAEDNLIHRGMDLVLPKVNFDNETIQSQDNLFFTFYGLYYSKQNLNDHSYKLRKKNIRFIARHNKDSRGNDFYRVFLGGYETEKEIMEAASRTESD
jgi:type II secretory pathway predicted ATPase ExeA